MTDDELLAEWRYIYAERLGMLVQADPNPPRWARDIAAREADEAVEELRRYEAKQT